MTDFFQEVNEEVRRDRTIEFIQRYRIAIAIAVVAVLAGTGGWRYWQTNRQAAAEAAGARYESAVQLAREGKPDEAQAALQAIAAKGPAGYALLARFRAAATIAEQKPDEAVKLYDALAADTSVEALFRDVARLRAAVLRIDKADAAEIASRIEPLAAPTNPLHASARELLAFAALNHDDFAAAGRWLDLIVTDTQAPAGVRQRADAMLGLVTGGGKAPAPAAPAPAPAAPAAGGK